MYLTWNKKIISDFSDDSVSKMFEDGYVFTRVSKGEMHQTRSLRIDLSKFSLNSENRRILKKTDGISIESLVLPLAEYDFKLGKLAKDFYDTKFGKGVMSAQKVKEMLTDSDASNFNALLIFRDTNTNAIGYTICFRNQSLLHYSYPFYDLSTSPTDMGMGMMIRAIQYAKESGLKHIYLGSLQRPNDVYKLQFEGLEWFDGHSWSTDLELAKSALKGTK